MLLSEQPYSSVITIETKCHDISCNELIEADLSLQDLLELNFEATNKKIAVIYKGKELVFRRPKSSGSN